MAGKMDLGGGGGISSTGGGWEVSPALLCQMRCWGWWERLRGCVEAGAWPKAPRGFLQVLSLMDRAAHQELAAQGALGPGEEGFPGFPVLGREHYPMSQT